MPGCVSPSSGPMTWTMPCAPLGEIEQRDAVLAAVPLERRRHRLGHHVGERPRLRARRHDVIDGRERALRRAHAPAARAQLVERLRARDFVDEMQADVELRLTVRQPADGVAVPDFLNSVPGISVDRIRRQAADLGMRVAYGRRQAAQAPRAQGGSTLQICEVHMAKYAVFEICRWQKAMDLAIGPPGCGSLPAIERFELGRNSTQRRRSRRTSPRASVGDREGLSVARRHRARLAAELRRSSSCAAIDC